MPLNGRKIMVVEDEYLVADDLAALLREAHAEVIGPVASLAAAAKVKGPTVTTLKSFAGKLLRKS